jgi:predicted Zn finger-like uncharacterized protein
MFRIVPDQLRISEGWVRCGQCDEVFDANVHLHSVDERVTSPKPYVDPTPVAESLAYDWGPALSGSQFDAAPVQPAPVEAVDHTAPVEAPDADAQQEPEQQPDPEQEATGLLGPDTPELHPESRFDGDWTATVYADPALLDPNYQPEPLDRLDDLADDPAPSFMTASAKPRPTQRWLGKKTLGAACGGLSLMLLMQVALHERDRIAAASPALEPMLVAACSVLSCTVSPLKEIESIAIDSSAFTSVRPGVYLLQLNLKNLAPTELATPALELTLTDGQERALLRRVVLPAELSGKPSVAAGMEMSATLPISVKAAVTPEKIAGYKLLAFYP